MTKKCPACGAEVQDNDLECGYCGSQIIPAALPMEQREEVLQLIRELNRSMQEQEMKLLRNADLVSIGFWMAGIAVILVAGVALRSNNIHLGMLLFSAAVLVIWRSFRRKRSANGLIALYRRDIDPKISAGCLRLGLPRWQFNQMASFELKESDLLGKFVSLGSSTRQR